MNPHERNQIIHPQLLGLCLLLLGITALFFGFSAAYLYSRFSMGMEPIKLPVLFIFNTIILIATSFILKQAMNHYKQDETEKYKRSLLLTLILTLVFLFSQIVAWMQLYDQGIFVNHSNMTSYLYIISIVHFAHVIAGIPFLGLFYFRAYKRMVEPVSVLVYFSDPDKKRKLKMLTLYWHFLDGLWIYLVLFFLVNYLF